MDADALRELCLSFRGAVETYPFSANVPVWKVGGKIFALALIDEPLSVNLKVEPGLGEQLREAHPEIRPGYHMNKRHWVTVSLQGALPESTISDLVEDSYDLVVSTLPRRRRTALRWPGDDA